MSSAQFQDTKSTQKSVAFYTLALNNMKRKLRGKNSTYNNIKKNKIFRRNKPNQGGETLVC